MRPEEFAPSYCFDCGKELKGDLYYRYRGFKQVAVCKEHSTRDDGGPPWTQVKRSSSP